MSRSPVADQDREAAANEYCPGWLHCYSHRPIWLEGGLPYCRTLQSPPLPLSLPP